MKIVNKKTGEVIDLSAPKEIPKSNEQKSEERIKERGTIQESVKKNISSPSIIKKAVGVSEAIDAPFSAIESAISNVGLKAQKGEIGIADAIKASGSPMAGPMDKGTSERIGNTIKDAMLGLSLQKQGQYGDIMKNAGYNPVVADTFGLILHLSPVKVYNEVSKTFGAISKMSDKAMMKAGTNLLDAVNQAKTAAGTKVTEAFAQTADNIPVDGFSFIEDVAKLPKPIMNRAEEVFGNLDEFANGLTIGKLREFKRFLGKMKPNSYGQAERGLQESLDVQDLSKVYGNLKNRMQQVMSGSLDQKTVNYLMKLEDAYSEVADAGRYIRKSVVESVQGKATRVGEFAKKVASDTDISARESINVIKKTSAEAMNRINKAMSEIERFNSFQTKKKLFKQAVGIGINAGIYSSIGNRIARKMQGQE